MDQQLHTPLLPVLLVLRTPLLDLLQDRLIQLLFNPETLMDIV